jgi:uncharacterized membrane protein HdeD (DUF308 family)
MTTFVNLSYTTSHPGVVRFERAYASAGHVIQRLQQESTYAAALLMFGALSLVASIYDIVDASQEGQELGAWVILWTAVLVGLVGLVVLWALAMHFRLVLALALALPLDAIPSR